MQKALGVPVRIVGDGPSLQLERIFLGSGTHNEAWLQELIFRHPEALPIAQIEPGFGTIVPAAREIACGHGFIDNLYLTPTGEIVLVEVKLWRNVQARRELVAQALDYVAALMRMDYASFETAILKASGLQAKSLHELVADFPDALAEPAFIDAVTTNLTRGRMLVTGLGDGIRQEAEALAELVQSHAGAHFTFALIELAIWRDGTAGDLLVVPSVLARTVMIERGILRIESGDAQISSEPSKVPTKAQLISDDMFFECIGKVDPGLPSAVRAFLAQLEPLGVYPDLKAALNLKADLPNAPKPINFGYIAKNGQLWTNPFSWCVPETIARQYNQALADLIGGVVSLDGEINLTINGKTAPKVTALLPDHADEWAELIGQMIKQITSLEALPG